MSTQLPQKAYINTISTVVPEHDVHDGFVSYGTAMLGDREKQLLFTRMVDRAQISHRWSPIPSLADFYGDDPDAVDTGTRMREFERFAPDLAVRAVDGLQLGERAADITHLIVLTCTGFFTPGIDFEIMARCGIPTTVERTQVGFMGCFAGINGLKLAHHIVRSEPSARVLVVSVELCTLHVTKTDDLQTMLSFMVFGDGAAAALVSADTHGLAMDSFQALMIEDSRETITWRIGSAGFKMHLSGKVPGKLARALDAETMKTVLAGAETSSVDLWAIHPGGRSILDAVEGALDLGSDELAVSRKILDEYGNMSSATVLFVLAEMMERGDTGSGCAMAFGPGLTAETMLFHAS